MNFAKPTFFLLLFFLSQAIVTQAQALPGNASGSLAGRILIEGKPAPNGTASMQ
jgi:hypothetical protein